MVTYQQLKYDPSSQALFNNRITTMEGLLSILKDHSFIALDTEHVPVDSQRNRILHQVGLAYIPAITPHTPIAVPSQPQRPRLKDFYDRNQLQSLTLNIFLTKQIREDLLCYRGSIPNRRPSRFGRECQIFLDNLGSAIVEFIRSCHHNHTKLVLIGFEMSAEWNYLSRNFSEVVPYFTSWIDLRDIAKDVAITGDAPGQSIPGRISLLQMFGYYWKDIKGSNQYGSADNAGDDAVSTLAMAEALFYPENQEKLRFHQECGQIAREKNVFINEDNVAFGATIQTENGILPNVINSGLRLAQYFFGFRPISIALRSPDVAVVTFKSKFHLNRFIKMNHRRVLSNGDTLLIIPIGVSDIDKAKREEKQQLRKFKKVEMLEQDFEGLGDIFS
ncbi:hypothetical protein F5B22DRAFT_636679 [Xylaria bambusicola]|uniref:uncharacterized protein n=1 Tax=Xylaria bambusicola TaxID=326684 RepID=UPI002008D290|nr:uncharacterized protein F5B22DRAFT_636679 [Xylaria bambusicola]KAI0515126.1 hypothetical protein F5B22DRAFT_636679 [Xylaria bambusicola]